MISLTAITVVFTLGWAVRQLWKMIAAAMATTVASSRHANEPAR